MYIIEKETRRIRGIFPLFPDRASTLGPPSMASAQPPAALSGHLLRLRRQRRTGHRTRPCPTADPARGPSRRPATTLFGCGVVYRPPFRRTIRSRIAERKASVPNRPSRRAALRDNPDNVTCTSSKGRSGARQTALGAAGAAHPGVPPSVNVAGSPAATPRRRVGRGLTSRIHFYGVEGSPTECRLSQNRTRPTRERGHHGRGSAKSVGLVAGVGLAS